MNDYDLEIPAEENKQNWYRMHMSFMRRLQNYAAENFNYELADSIYRSSKDLETEYYAYRAENQTWAGGFSRKFNAEIYRYFNGFMGWFCGYGTLPVDSIYNAGVIVLIFAVFFIVFPTRMSEEREVWEFQRIYVLLSLYSGPDSPLDKFFREFKAFRRERPKAGLRQFLESHTETNLREFQENLPGSSAFYIEALLNSKRNVFVRLFLWLYAWPFLMQVKLLHLFDRLGERRRAQLRLRKKRPTLRRLFSPRFGLIVFGLLVSWLALRVPQGLFISVNAFSTLGFGSLPLRGLCKYLAILEGLIGWFTLSLFSITYVNILMR